MGLTLEQLLAVKTKEEHRDALLLHMQGVGYVQKRGPGEGSIALSGVALIEATVVIEIVVDGSLGNAYFRYSLDGGETDNGVDILVPSLGNYTIPSTGVTVTFANGPGLAEDSFFDGDTFTFDLAIPTLPTTSWHAGSVPLTIIETDAAANEDFSQSQLNVAKGGFLSTAEDAWLDLLLQEVYDTQRVQGQIAKHQVVLTDSANSGPHAITPGQLVAGTATGLRFSNSTGGNLLQGGTLTLTFDAEKRGTAYNVAIGAINTLLTSLPGVSITNTEVGSTGLSLLQQGVDRESNAAARARAQAQWGTLGTGAVEDAYRRWASDASDQVTRVRVKPDPVTPGNILLILAGPAGPVSGGVVATVEAAVQDKVVFGSVLTAQSAGSTAVAVSATVYVRAGYSGTALAQMLSNLNALFQGGTTNQGEELEGLPISDGTVKVYRTELLEMLQVAEGVRNVDLATFLPAAEETTVGLDNVAILSPTPVLTIVEV